MSPSRQALLVIAVPALLVAGSPAANAQPADIHCGSTITSNTRLSHDVGPCSGTGLVVGADHITLDLGGHRVFGQPTPGEGAGVLLPQRIGVHVTNGTVSGFDGGVAILGGSNNMVFRVTARDNIGPRPYDNPQPPQGQLELGDGIAVLSSTNNRVINNVAEHNGPFSGIGLFQEVDSDHPRDVTGPTTGNLVVGNVVTRNDVCRVDPGTPQSPRGFCDDDGIRLEPGVTRNTVVDNTVTGSALDGIAMFFQSADNDVRGNRVEANGFHRATHRKGDGIRVFLQADRTQVTANRVLDNAANGIRIDSVSNRIVGNTALGNARASTSAFDLYDNNPNCDDNQWRGNRYGTAFPACVA